MRLIFDSHDDLAWIALGYDRDITETLAQINERERGMHRRIGWGDATSCLPELRRGGVAVCLGTLVARTKRHSQPTDGYRRTDIDYGTQSLAYAAVQGQLAYYRMLAQQGEMTLIGTVRELDEHWRRWEQGDNAHLPIGTILSMECADPIVDPCQAEAWFDAGLRSVMLAHYGKGSYAVGTGESGPLTSRGIELLKEFERVGMILDVTHLSDPSFFEALSHFSGPVMASHSNCRALVPGDRQFSDDQIRLLLERDAVIGVACDAWMLRPDWQIGQSQPDGLTLSAVVDQIDHICQLAGNAAHVGVGCDLGGGYGTEQMPTDLETVADLHRLESLLNDRGYESAEIDQIFHGNWLRFFRRWLPA